MDYLMSGFFCSGIREGDEIKMEEMFAFVDNDTNEIQVTFNYKENHQYTYKKVWVVKKGYSIIKGYHTEEEAKKAYEELFKEIEKDNRIIKL